MDWDSLKVIGNWIWYLIVPILEVKIMKQDIALLKTNQAVTDSQIKDIRDDIHDLTKVIREAEKTITEDLKDLGKEIRNGLHSSNNS